MLICRVYSCTVPIYLGIYCAGYPKKEIVADEFLFQLGTSFEQM
jgi:hypothetical protein